MAEQPIRHDEIIQPGDPFEQIKKSIKELLELLEKLQTETKESAKAWKEYATKQNPATKEGRKNLNEAAKATDKLSNEQKQYNKALGETKRLQSDVGKETIRLQQANRQLRKGIQDSSKAAEAQKGSLERNRIALRKLTDRYNKAAPEAAKKMTRRVDELTNKIKRQEAVIGKHQRNVGNYKSAFDKAKTGLASFAAGAVSLTVGISALFRTMREGLREMQTFEAEFANVLNLLDQAAITQFGGMLSRESKRLMKEFGLGAEEVNRALFNTISAGVEAGDAIEFLRAALELSVGGAADLNDAVLGMTKVMNAYGLTGQDATRIAEAFFSAQKFGQTTVQELAASIGNTTGIAAQAGIQYDELMATFAVLTKRLKNTDETATAIRATITALINPSEQAQAAFESMGIETGILALRNNGLFVTLAQIASATGENADMLTELIPNVRALAGVGVFTTEALSEYDQILQQIQTDTGEASSLTNAFNRSMDTQQKMNQRAWQQLKQFVGTMITRNRSVEFAVDMTMLQLEVMGEQIETEEQLTEVVDRHTASLLKLEAAEEKRLQRMRDSQRLIQIQIDQEEPPIIDDELIVDDTLDKNQESIDKFYTWVADKRAKEGDAEVAEWQRKRDAFLQFQDQTFSRGLAGLDAFLAERDILLNAAAIADQVRAIGQTIIALTRGTAQTAAVGFPQNIPLLIGFAGQVAGLLATIKKIKFEHGGSGELGNEGTVLSGERHHSGGVNLGEIGEAERGEYFGIINRAMTRRYSDDLPEIFNTLNKGTFHSVFGRANEIHDRSMPVGDPYTKKMYMLMMKQANIYTDTNGDQVIEYMNGKKRTIRAKA